MIKQRQTRQTRQHWIDAIKGLATIFVIVQHFRFPSGVPSALLTVFWAGAAVPFFMILTGYTWSMSYSKKSYEHLEDFYDIKDLRKKVIRFTVPALIVALLQTFYLLVSGNLTSIQHFFSVLFNGGLGLGSYYFPMVLQLVLIMPVIHFLVVKFRKRGVWLFFALNIFYELIQNFWNIGDGAYRVLVFRYLFALVCGVYFYTYGIRYTQKVNALLVVMGICGIIVLSTLQYGTDKESIFHIIFSKWSTVSVLTILYYFPLLLLLQELFKVWKPQLLILLGRASYHILFSQMVGFYFLQQFNVVVPLHYSIVLPIYIVLFTSIGYWFYSVEAPLNNRVQKWVDR